MPAAGVFGDDADLTITEGLSELATPKDHSHWLRHGGPDDAGGPSLSIVSPTPLTSFSSFHVPASPRVADMRSPYALALEADDLYDAEYGPPDAATGKRAALPMMRSSSQGQGKRHKVG